MPLLYSVPLTVALNTETGYIINPFTGDSIRPILNSLGDTIKTGVPVSVQGKPINPDSVSQPEIIQAGEPRVELPGLNIHEIPESLTVIPVNNTSLKTYTPVPDTSSLLLVTSTGKAVVTGVPIPIKGKVVPGIRPQPVIAHLPDRKDNASTNMNYLDVDQGMNSSYVLSILEDSHGNLWFGSGGGGVSKYNGETFTHYTKKEGLSDDLVYSSLEDRHGNLWFGTYLGGVSMYNGETFTHFTENEGLSDNSIFSIVEDQHGNLWFGTGGGGVSKYNGETFIHLTSNEGLSNNIVRSICEDRNGILWFATEGGGVCRYNGNTFTYFTENEGLCDDRVYCIVEDREGNLWFGTGAGVSMYDGESFTSFTEKEGLSNNYVWSILEDNNGNLWFGTSGGGLSMYDGETFRHFTEEEGLSNNIVRSMLQDSQGHLWFGTWRGGVSMYCGESFAHFTTKEGLSHNDVLSIIEDHQDNLWFGTWGGGVSMFNGKTISYITETEGLSNDIVFSMIEDSQGNIWFGTFGSGVSKFDGKTFTNYTRKEGLCNDIVRSILEDSHGNLWFGTWGGGVTMYNGESFIHLTEKEGLSHNYVLSIIEDQHGNLWFGTWGHGVSMYDGKTFTHYTEKEGLQNMFVWSMLEDSHGNLWFGTNNGVSVYNGDTFMHFSEKEGLSHHNVYSIVEENNGNIWLSTEKGLNCIVPGPDGIHSEDHYPAIHIYSQQDGVKGLNFNPNSALLDSRNRIWWGSGTSLTMLDLNNFKSSFEVPKMRLNRIDINEQFVDYRYLKDRTGIRVTFDSVARFDNYPINLVLPYNNNHLTFHFSGIEWFAPQKILYSYKMEGLNNNWSFPSSQASADYRSLPFGTYTFKVCAIGGAQTWSEPFEYTFTINPPWWHTWWAKTGYVITAILTIFGLVLIRTAKLKQQQGKLETEVDNATLKIREQKEEVETQRDEIVAANKALEIHQNELVLTLENLKLTQSQLMQSEKMASVGILSAGIAHELNNPINFVSGNVKPLIRDVNEVLTIIKKYDQIVKSSKLEGEFGEVVELKSKMDFSYIIKEIIDLLEGIQEGANRSSQIVKGLRSFSRLDNEKFQLYDISEGIDSTLVLLRSKLKGRIKVRKEIGNSIEIECYPGKLNQVFMNILTNSIQAIEDRGEIFVQTISSGIGIKIIIKDNGKGMTQEVKKHIFEPFYTTKNVGEGTGLGLSISYGIIEQHNGNIEVISKPDTGTEFIISLPRTQPDQDLKK